MHLSGNKQTLIKSLRRVRFWYLILLAVIGIFGVRLFYLQVISYGHFKNAALSDQLKEYTIPARRGLIYGYDGGQAVPIVLNQELYTIYADPGYIKSKDVPQITASLVKILGGKSADYAKSLTMPNSRYEVLAQKVSKQKEQKLLANKFAGIGAKADSYRVYPQGGLAAQVLGFVNANGVGSYGVEQALNDKLAGKPGMLKAITDIHGVPLAASPDNVSIPAKPGKDLQLTIDIGMQRQMETILKNEYKQTRSKGLSAVIMDPHTGAIKAMANYPTYNPAHYDQVKNYKLFENAAASRAIEPGSSMKPFTVAAALNQGVVQPDTTFYDPAHWLINGFNITDIAEDGPARVQSVQSTLSLSLNTGATWLLMQMSHPGGTKINLNGIKRWHNYMTKHFMFGQATGLQQGYESAGYVPSVDVDLPAQHLKFANTSFGQGVTATVTQMAAGLSSLVNGGIYYQPNLVAGWYDSSGNLHKHQPVIKEKHVIKPDVSREMWPLMENVVKKYYSDGFSYMKFSNDYMVGGKTGTAQIAKPDGGGYYDNLFNGTYIGFVGGNKPQYVIVVFNIKPDTPGYAGSYGGQPVFADLAHMLINNGYVTPKH